MKEEGRERKKWKKKESLNLQEKKGKVK